MSIEKYKDKLEPEALNLAAHEWEEASQAISLKRIADALEKLTAVPTMKPLTDEQEKEFKKEWDAMAGNVIFNKS